MSLSTLLLVVSQVCGSNTICTQQITSCVKKKAPVAIDHLWDKERRIDERRNWYFYLVRKQQASNRCKMLHKESIFVIDSSCDVVKQHYDTNINYKNPKQKRKDIPRPKDLSEDWYAKLTFQCARIK